MADIQDFGTEEIQHEFYSRKHIVGSMVNEIKADLFFDNFNEFTIEQFEQFLKGLNVVI